MAKSTRVPKSFDDKYLIRACETHDLKALAKLPPPGKRYKDRSTKQLGLITAHLVRVWAHIVLDKTFSWDEVEVEFGADSGFILRGESAVACTLFVIAAHYHQAAVTLIDRIGIKYPASVPGIDMDVLNDVAGKLPDEDGGLRSRACWFTFGYFYCIWGAFLMCLMHHNGVRNAMAAGLEEGIHGTTNRMLHELGERDTENIEWQLKWSLLQDCFDTLAFAYHFAANRPRSSRHGSGYFDVDLAELPALACREEYAIGKYGSKGIEKQFEVQLSLLMQSFGFRVVSAAPGERAVDLICIPQTASVSGAVLIDAKSSQHSYGLTAKDARALKEYFEHVTATVTALPPITDLLIVGSRPTPSLAGRLKDLETQIRANVRFCRANDLAELRRRSLGSLDHGEFIRVLRQSPHVVTHAHLRLLLEREQAKNESLTNLVKTFLGTRR